MGLNLVCMDEFCTPANTVVNWTVVYQKLCTLFLVNSTIKYFIIYSNTQFQVVHGTVQKWGCHVGSAGDGLSPHFSNLGF